jgi:LmbE family N-acetylglucosaminyl deacetylase
MKQVYNVVSPHLDDAALSCSMFLAGHPGSCITTVFASGPPSVRPLTPWDKGARYFPEGADVMGVRRGEDISAAAMVNASAFHLDYWDRQYRNERYGYDGPPEDRLLELIAKDLAACVGRHPGQPLVMPLGLGHPDHRVTAEACLILAESEPRDIYLYEELPYAVENAAEAADRKTYLVRRGFTLEEDAAVATPHDRALKAAVLRCHASQCRSLRRRWRTAARTPERIWRLIPFLCATRYKPPLAPSSTRRWLPCALRSCHGGSEKR